MEPVPSVARRSGCALFARLTSSTGTTKLTALQSDDVQAVRPPSAAHASACVPVSEVLPVAAFGYAFEHSTNEAMREGSEMTQPRAQNARAHLQKSK